MVENPCRCGCGATIPIGRVYAYMHAPGASSTATRHAEKRESPIGECVYCDAACLTQAGWRMRTAEERKGFRRIGTTSPEIRCNRCHKACKRAEDPNKSPGNRAPIVRGEDMLEEWALLRSDGVTDLAVAAARIGTTRVALQKCLERARRRGDPRGVVRRQGDLGGATQGRTGPRRRAA